MNIRLASIALLLPMIFATACATIPKDPSGVDVSMRVISDIGVVTRFGTVDSGKNPFLVPGSAFTVNPDDYIVLSLKFDSSIKADFSLADIVAQDKDGHAFARFMPWEDFSAYTKDWNSDGKEAGDKHNAAARVYLTHQDFSLRPGSGDYVVVLIGKKPFPAEFTVTLTFSIDGKDRSVTVQGKR